MAITSHKTVQGGDAVTFMHFEDADRLLDPRPLPLEMGYERLENGVLHVACRTDMRGCTAAMLQWWFASLPGTDRYHWWHPIDHIRSEWAEAQNGHIGSIHVATESFIGGPPTYVSIQFQNPAEAFSAGALDAACAEGRVSGVLFARAGESHTPHRTPDGAMIGSRLLHVCRDTAWGTVLRSHYFLGHDLPGIGLPPAAIAAELPDQVGPGLVQHCYEEFTFLAEILPGLHRAEALQPSQVVRPW